MKKSSLFIAFVFISVAAYSWGKTGHRVVGQIAYEHLSKKARKNIQIILGDEQLGMVGNYMDFIRSSGKHDHMTTWHYCTIPDGKTYQEADTPENGGAIMTIQRMITELTSKKFTDEDELFTLKCLVHLVADIHQPLHVGNGTDKGGNDVKVKFMYQRSNLHRVWDSGLVDHQQLGYTEYTDWIDNASENDISKWQSESIMVWVKEAMDLRPQVYKIPQDSSLSWQYNFDNIATVNERLLKAGIRLAGILDEIYG